MITSLDEIEEPKRQLCNLWRSNGTIDEIKKCIHRIYNLFVIEYGSLAKDRIRNDILEITSTVGIPYSFANNLISEIERERGNDYYY